MQSEDVTGHVERIRCDGYTIVENAIEPELVAALNHDLVRLEEDLEVKPAGNSFEGEHTVRIYNLLVHGALYFLPKPYTLKQLAAAFDVARARRS